MRDLFTYSLSDFLLFAPETYFRLFQLYNAWLWPAQFLAVFFGLGLLWLVRRPGTAGLPATVLVVAWFWVAWGWFLQHYATINWAADYMAAAFALQALLLAVIGARRPASQVKPRGPGLFLMAFAIVAQPLIGPLTGLSWSGIELFGLTPDSTAVATLGFFLLLEGRIRWLLLPIPIAWCVMTGTTAWAMDWPAGLVAPAVSAAVLLLGFPLQTGVRRRRGA